jgi:hypothetical protein
MGIFLNVLLGLGCLGFIFKDIFYLDKISYMILSFLSAFWCSQFISFSPHTSFFRILVLNLKENIQHFLLRKHISSNSNNSHIRLSENYTYRFHLTVPIAKVIHIFLIECGLNRLPDLHSYWCIIFLEYLVTYDVMTADAFMFNIVIDECRYCRSWWLKFRGWLVSYFVLAI